MRRDPLAFLEEVAGYGPMAHFRIGRQDVFLLSDPAGIEDVLVANAASFRKGRALERAKQTLGEGLLTSEGSFHLRQRRLVQPAFHKARVTGYADAMIRAAVAMRERWQAGRRERPGEPPRIADAGERGGTISQERPVIGDAGDDLRVVLQASRIHPGAGGKRGGSGVQSAGIVGDGHDLGGKAQIVVAEKIDADGAQSGPQGRVCCRTGAWSDDEQIGGHARSSDETSRFERRSAPIPACPPIPNPSRARGDREKGRLENTNGNWQSVRRIVI
jgi:hypothetical protein